MTFTFTIDCMPAYTKFNKKKKVMATLQVVDKTDTTHNYKNKDVLGHNGRTKDSDVAQWYSKSVFSKAAAATSTASAADEQHSDVTANAVDSTTNTSEAETTPSVSKLKRSVAK